MAIFALGLLLWLLGAQMREISHLNDVARSAASEEAHESASGGVSPAEPDDGAPPTVTPVLAISEKAVSTSLAKLHREVLEAAEPRRVPSWIRDQTEADVAPTASYVSSSTEGDEGILR